MSPEELTTLNALVTYLTGAGAAALAFVLVEKIKWPDGEEPRRYFSFVVAAAIGLVAWGVGIEFRYIEQPVADWHAWVEGAAGLVLPIIIAAQVLHARVVLGKKTEE